VKKKINMGEMRREKEFKKGQGENIGIDPLEKGDTETDNYS